MEPHFFQLLDRIRYEASVAALARDGKSLAIISPVQALAEHYKDMLMSRLAVDVPQARIKAFFPADTDAIVSSFNQVVADLPLAQAMAAPTSDRPLQVWVVHEATALPAGEVLMMLDLLDKFPGAHVRALLVFAGTEIAPEGLDGFEKSLMRWTIERPSLDQIKDSLSRVDDPLQAAEVRDLISRMAPGSSSKRVAAGMSVPGSATAAAPSGAQPPTKTTSTPSSKRAEKSNTASKAKSTSTRLKIAGLVTGLFLFSAGVAAWLNPQVLNVWMDKPAAEAAPALPATTPATAPATTSEPVAESDKTQELQAASTTATPDAPAEGKAPDTSAATPAATSVPPAAPEKVYALMTPEERKLVNLEAQPEPKAKPGKASKTADILVELPAGATEGQAWVKGFARGTFVVQHTNSETYAKARDRQKRFPNLSEAKVVPQFEADQSQAKFALISGPFDSKELADSFLKTENMPKESWVRSSRAIQKRLTPHSSVPTEPPSDRKP